ARQVPLENAPPDADRGYITLLGVLPSCRRQGIGTQLLEAAEEHLRSQGRTSILISPYAPGYFTPGVDVNAYPEGLRFLLARGCQERSGPLSMETSLGDWSPPAWVAERERQLLAEGVALHAFEPPLALPLLEFARREFGGDWARVARETMTRILEGA